MNQRLFANCDKRRVRHHDQRMERSPIIHRAALPTSERLNATHHLSLVGHGDRPKCFLSPIRALHLFGSHRHLNQARIVRSSRNHSLLHHFPSLNLAGMNQRDEGNTERFHPKFLSASKQGHRIKKSSYLAEFHLV